MAAAAVTPKFLAKNGPWPSDGMNGLLMTWPYHSGFFLLSFLPPLGSFQSIFFLLFPLESLEELKRREKKSRRFFRAISIEREKPLKKKRKDKMLLCGQNSSFWH